MNDPDNLTEEEINALKDAFFTGLNGGDLVIDGRVDDKEKVILMAMHKAGISCRLRAIETIYKVAYDVGFRLGERMAERGL